ncbi:hypothetical protein SD15574_4793 [Shigella dysenteriae 155-74]|nr:hypothetical protein SD15574_4793 [Shigella dysenteriae 155-74]
MALEVEQRVLAHPLYPVLTSMPGVGVRTAARLLTEVACRAFASAAHLAAYAGLAPVTRRSGSSIRGEHPSRRGNKALKRALFLSAFAALSITDIKCQRCGSAWQKLCTALSGLLKNPSLTAK